jgi:hypothetical protein
MILGMLLIAFGLGACFSAVVHYRDSGEGRPLRYPLSYDLVGAAMFLVFGIGALLQMPLFIGRARLLLLLLIPIALLKWAGILGRR